MTDIVNGELNCPICYEIMESGNCVSFNECHHEFCRCCFDELIFHANCRCPLDNIEIRNLYAYQREAFIANQIPIKKMFEDHWSSILEDVQKYLDLVTLSLKEIQSIIHDYLTMTSGITYERKTVLVQISNVLSENYQKCVELIEPPENLQKYQLFIMEISSDVHLQGIIFDEFEMIISSSKNILSELYKGYYYSKSCSRFMNSRDYMTLFQRDIIGKLGTIEKFKRIISLQNSGIALQKI